MTIDEAIKNNNITLTRYPHILDDDALAAIRLGIEALKRVKHQQEGPRVIVYKELPGETLK